ncbi:MAG: type I-U CRISPR-associated protein Csx17 [Gammaproteobacteria bacterium]|nr:type I-U CRISPR-associated protein Csx17 [Gammaproteobacteria bacterium]
MKNEHVLQGCTPTPLASYLKALAVLRLVAEAGTDGGGDSEATGFWRDDMFVLRTRLTKEELREFFLDRYRPTPLLSPWNGRAGFLEGEEKDVDEGEDTSAVDNDEDQDEGESMRIGAEMVRTFTQATLHARFEPIKKAIEGFQRVRVLDFLNVNRAKAKALEAEIKKNKKARLPVSDDHEDRLKTLKAETKGLKAQVLLQLRNEADEGWLSWFDACQSLAQVSSTKEQDRNKPLHAPLLGKGGVDGSMDFGVNFQKRVTQLFDLSTGKPLPSCEVWLDHALFDLQTASLIAIKPGQFNPGIGKFPNSGNGFLGEELGNPWNSMLSLEGAMLFATAMSRRLESSGPGMLSAPFTVTSRVSGVGSANLRDESEKLTNGEIWMPIWSAPASYDEIRCLFTEGRAAVNGRSARDGLDFARAVAQLGVDRGIHSFQRFGFLKRFGKTYLAAPLARLPVRRNEDADLIADLEKRRWLRSVQQYACGKFAPDSFRSAAHQLDTALFTMTQQASRTAVHTVLCRVGQIEAAVSLSAKAQKEIPSAPQLRSTWVTKYDDPSAEYRIATALAGLRLYGKKQIEGRLQVFALTARHHLVAINEKCSAWDRDSRLAVWGPGPLTGNIAALLHRRRLVAIALGAEGEALASQTGATRDDVAAFLDGATDDVRIGELLGGLACVDWNGVEPPRGDTEEAVLPPAFTLLKVFYTSEPILHALKWLPPDRSLRLPAEIPARLAANDVQAAMRIAWQRLRAFGVKLPGRNPPQVAGVDGTRWLAALCIPLTSAETARLLRGLDLNPEFDPDTTEPTETVA